MRDKPFFKATYTALLVVAIMAVLGYCMTSCDYLAQISEDIVSPHNTPPNSHGLPDTCTDYQPVNTPSFVQRALEIDGNLNTWVLNVGPYTDTLHAGEESLLDNKFSLLLNSYFVQFQSETFSNDAANRIAVFMKGTDYAPSLNGKVFIRANSAKYYMTFSKRAFYLGGAASLTEWQQLCEEYPSMTGFNLRDLVADSIGENSAMLAVLDSCKDGTNKRADFRFNEFEPSDSIVNAFKDAHWNVVQSFTEGDENSRTSVYENGKKVGVYHRGILDARHYKITDKQILAYLNNGIQVITD